MKCKFCKSEADFFTVNGEAICDKCILKENFQVCTCCGKATRFTTDNLCLICQNKEKD